MKIKRKTLVQQTALAALGVFLGRGAHADTIIDFDFGTPPPRNALITHPFGDYVSNSSDGVTVVGFGTPNIGVSWEATGDPATEWEYYNDSVWAAGQLNHSIVGSANDVVFAPNNATAVVEIKSFNFHPYYDSDERFTYDISILSGTTVVSGPIHVTFRSDATKNHPVNLNYIGAPGQTLKLRMARAASVLSGSEYEGIAGDIAADDITFAQLPTVALPAGPQVVSVTPADDGFGVAGNASYLASITNGDSTVVMPASIQLRFDGVLVSPPPVISSSGDLTNVFHAATSLLASGSTHAYKLTYADNLGGRYTNDTVFTVANYVTLPPAYASPAGSGSHPGFTWRTVVARQDTPDLDSSIARAVAQLNGTLIDPATSTPYTNAVPPGTNSDGSFNIPAVVNFDDNFLVEGNFPDDQPFPGADQGPYNWFSCEGLFYLDLPAGYYRLGVNSDDGFEFNATPPQGVSGSPIVLGLYDDGRAADNTFFDFYVQTSGVYNFQLIYFESKERACCELFSVDTSAATPTMALINDVTNSAAIKSFQVIPPRITSAVRSGTDLVISWAYGLGPFQLQFKNNLNSTWTNLGAPTNARSAHVAIQPGAGFVRVVGSP